MIPPPFQIIPVLNSYIEGAIERHNQPRKISIREGNARRIHETEQSE